MTTRVVIGCDGDWNGMPCRGAISVAASRLTLASNDDLADLYRARNVAFEAGWRQTPGQTGDLCPAHARAQQAELMRAAADEQMPLQINEHTAAWLTSVFGPDWPRHIPAPDRSTR